MRVLAVLIALLLIGLGGLLILDAAARSGDPAAPGVWNSAPDHADAGAIDRLTRSPGGVTGPDAGAGMLWAQ